MAFLINTSNLKRLGFIHQNVDDTLISNMILKVQDLMIEPILGTTLYKRLLEGVDNSDLTANETTLLQDYVTPCLKSGCELRAVNVITFQFRNKTVGTTQDPNISAATDSQRADISDDLRRDFEFYRKKLIGYLCDNSTLFPEYENYETDKEDIKPDKGAVKNNIRFI